MQQVQLVLESLSYVLEEEGGLAVVEHLGVAVEGVAAELEEVAVVVEEDAGGRLLVVALVARVEYLDAVLPVRLRLTRRNPEPRRPSSEVDRDHVRELTLL